MMREVISADELWAKARAIGQYYGFTPFSTLAEKTRGTRKKDLAHPAIAEHAALDPVAEIVANFLQQCRESVLNAAPRQPLFVWHTNLAPGRTAHTKAIVQFHAFGGDRALTDAVVIRAIMALVRNLFHKEPELRINSMGDKETRARYARELSNFFKKHAAVLPGDCVACAKRDTLEAAGLLIASAGSGSVSDGRDYVDDLPASTEYLSDTSRKRFEDLLEYLEMTGTPYELARTLISRSGMWNDMCFELVLGGHRVAFGSRYGDFLHHIHPMAPASATGAVLQLATAGAVLTRAKVPRLRFSFVHIGDEAKRLSIHLAEAFNRSHVSLSQHIGIESLIDQMRLAERQDSPYLLIMGRKEALEGLVILRDRRTQKEMTLPLDGLPERLKALA